MSRLQVGGLALVINSTSGLNLGKVVELIVHCCCILYRNDIKRF